MSKRFYIVPKVGAGTHDDPFGPKYVGTMGVAWAAMDYGKEDSMLVGAEVTDPQHTTLAANLDVIPVPLALDSNVASAALAAVKTRVSGVKVPTSHLTSANTYRDVIRLIGKCFLLAQRFDGLHRKTLFEIGAGLNTQFNQMAQLTQDNLRAAIESLGISSSFIAPTMTLETILKTVSDALPSFELFGETF